MTEGRPVCRTESEVVGALGQIASVIGTYELKPFTNQKGVFFREWPVVVLAGGGRPVLIESLWDEDKQPSPEVLNRYRGKRVEVVGRLHAQPPGRIANLAVPCVSPVEQLLILE